VRNAFALPIIIAALAASLIAGCGDDGGTTTTTAGGTTTTTAGGSSAVCATFALVQSAGNDLKQIDPSQTTPAEVKKAVSNLGKSAQALGSAASEAGGQAKSDVEPAVRTFQSELDSAEGQPISQQLITLGTALGQLKTSLSQTLSDFDCTS
jgi:hypothetical protein